MAMKHSREALLLVLLMITGVVSDQLAMQLSSSASTALDRGISIKNRNGGGYVLLAQFEQYANSYIIACLTTKE